jgi:hypothetical protein
VADGAGALDKRSHAPDPAVQTSESEGMRGCLLDYHKHWRARRINAIVGVPASA